jgi:hypothetical protein
VMYVYRFVRATPSIERGKAQEIRNQGSRGQGNGETGLKMSNTGNTFGYTMPDSSFPDSLGPDSLIS